MNFENEEQANAYMSAEAEGEAEAQAAHDVAVAEMEASDFQIIKDSLEVLRFKVGSEYVKSKNIPAELMMNGVKAAERMQTELDALREANAHKNAVIEDLIARNAELEALFPRVEIKVWPKAWSPQ